jgi:hypothetical protein
MKDLNCRWWTQLPKAKAAHQIIQIFLALKRPNKRVEKPAGLIQLAKFVSYILGVEQSSDFIFESRVETNR